MLSLFHCFNFDENKKPPHLNKTEFFLNTKTLLYYIDIVLCIILSNIIFAMNIKKFSRNNITVLWASWFALQD